MDCVLETFQQDLGRKCDRRRALKINAKGNPSINAPWINEQENGKAEIRNRGKRQEARRKRQIRWVLKEWLRTSDIE